MALRHYQATSTVETRFAYRCATCGYEGMAAVEGEGYVEADVATGARGDIDPARRALDAAEGRAWQDALSTVDLAPCPRCGARDRGRWRHWLRAELPGAVLWGALGALVGALGAFLLRQRLDALPLVAAALTAPAVTGAILAARVHRKRARAATLRFEPATEGSDDAPPTR